MNIADLLYWISIIEIIFICGFLILELDKIKKGVRGKQPPPRHKEKETETL